MLLALLALALVTAALVLPVIVRAARSRRVAGASRRRVRRRGERLDLQDPGRERRAEQRARELLRSCVSETEWEMYRDLGFLRVAGRLPSQVARGETTPALDRSESSGPADGPRRRAAGEATPEGQAPYAYLIYPHRPIVAYVPATRRLLSEYCVEFPDLSAAVTGSRLPDSDDVLAKWMALTGDEERLIRTANMHLPGRQLDPGRVRRDLWRLAEWDRRRRDSSSARARRG